jgi:hypothetical protein
MSLQKVLQLGPNNEPTQYSPVQSSSGTASAGQIVALNAAGQIDETMLPSYEALTFTASEAIAAGAFVNIWNNSGTANVRNANATDNTKPCNGWAPASISPSAMGTITFVDINSFVPLGSFTIANVGQEVFLSTTSGGMVAASNTFTTGNLVQCLGTITAVGATVSVAFFPKIVTVY